MNRASRSALETAFIAHGVGYALALCVAVSNAPRTSELGALPSQALARGLVPEGVLAWWDRTGTSFLVGACGLFVLSSLFGSASRLAIARAFVYDESPSAAYMHALRVLPRTLLARFVLLLGTLVLLVISSAPLVSISLLWQPPVDVRLHDLTVLGLVALPLIALFVAHMLDDMVHTAIIVHGPRALEAVVSALRSLHRQAVYGAVGSLLFVLGARVLVARFALVLENGFAVSVASFGLLGVAALVRAKLLMHYAREVQRFGR